MRLFAKGNVVYTFDVDIARTRQNYSPHLQSINKATVFKGFYTDEYEDNLSQRFEQGVKTILEKIAMGQQLGEEERLRLSRYIYAYRYRSPWMLRLLRNKYEPEMRVVIQEQSQMVTFLQSTLPDNGRPIEEDLFKKMRTILADKESELDDAETVQASLQSFFSGGPSPSIGPQQADRELASLPWRVFVSEGHQFVLGDYFFELYGQDQPIFEMYFPISATHCLFVSRYAPDPRLTREHLEYLPVDPHITRAINVRTVKKSERYVISGQDLSWASRARNTPSAKHLDLKIPSIQTQRLVGRYISSRCPQCWWALTPGSTIGRQLEKVQNDIATVQTFKQRDCSNPECNFVTTFQGPHEVANYTLGAGATAILQRLCPSDRALPTVEDTQLNGTDPGIWTGS